MQTILQIQNEINSKLYEKLNAQVLNQIRGLRRQKADAATKKNNPKFSSVTRNVWCGVYTGYSNALCELELAHERAHYSEKFANK